MRRTFVSKLKPVINNIYFLSCLMLFSLVLSLGMVFAQTSDELLFAQINPAEAGAVDLQASVIIVAGDSVFIDAGRVAGVDKSSFQGGQLMRRTAAGEELIGNFQVVEVGGEVTQVAVMTIFAKEVQMGDRAVFGAYAAEAPVPNGQPMQVNQNNGQNVFTNTFGDNPAGRAIGVANTSVANTGSTNAGFAEQAASLDTQVTKSSVIPAGTAAAFLADVVSNAVAKNAATGAPLYCSDARFANREACMAPVPLMANSSVNPVNPVTATATTTATVTTTTTVTAANTAPSAYQQVSQTATAANTASSAAQPGYCIDARFSSRPECMTSVTASVSAPNTTAYNTVSTVASSVPAYCSTPGNENRPECSVVSSTVVANTGNTGAVISQRGYQTNQTSHISTATAATPNAPVGTALAIDPYTGKPYTTSYNGYEGAATPLVHTAAHSQATQQTNQTGHTQTSQFQTIQLNQATPTVANQQTTIGLATGSAAPSAVINVPTHVGPATIANQTLTTAPNSSYATAQTYYDSDWGDNWDPTFVNTTPTASGIIPADAPAPYFLRIARVKNNLGFPNEAIEILEMGLGKYPNDVSLNSEVTMIYRMLSDGGTPADWCPPEEIGIAPQPIATVDDCADEEVSEHTHAEDSDHHGADHGHSHDDDYHHHEDHHEDYGEDHDNDHHEDTNYDSNHYANDHQEHIQVSTRYNAPLNSGTPLDNAPAVNQSYAAQNKPSQDLPIGVDSNFYNSEKGGIVRPLWNTEK